MWIPGLSAALVTLCLAALAPPAGAGAQGEAGGEAAGDAGPDCLAEAAGWIEQGRYERALEEIGEALAGAQGETEGRWRQLRSRALRLSGRARSEEALADALLAVEWARRSGEGAREASALFDLGALAMVRGQLGAAEEALEQALEACARGGSEAQVLRSEILVYRAECALQQGGPREFALADFAVAEEIQQRLLGPLDARAALRLMRQANLAYADGDLRRAVELGERALAAFRACLPPAHPRIATALHNLGTYLHALGELPEAAPALEEALELRLANDPANAGRTLALLGQVREALGDLEGAERMHASALERLERALGADDPSLRLARRELAHLALRRGDPDGAERHLLRMAEQLERDEGADRPERAELLDLFARLERARGREQDAIELWGRALALLAAEGGQGLPAEVPTLSALGMVLVRSSDASAVARGCELLERALALQRGTYGRSHPEIARTLEALAHGRNALGDDEQAFETALEAAEIARELLASSSDRLVERDALGYSAELRPGLGLALALATRSPAERGLRAWNALAAARAQVFDAMRLRQEALRARARASAPLHREPIGESSARSSQHSSIEGIAGARAEGRALLAFARCRLPNDYVGLALAPGSSTPRVLRLGSAREIEELVASLQGALGSEAGYRERAMALRERVWDPLAAELEGASEILLVPDGALLFVDFDALPEGERAYRIERGPPIQVLNAEREATQVRPRRARPAALLALGAPDYGLAAEAGGAGGGARSFQPLAESEAEVREIAASWEARGVPAQVLTGAMATERALADAVSGASILHFATHGFAALQPSVAGERGVAILGAAESKAAPLRMELSRRHLGSAGLALAGANLGAALDSALVAEDGILSDEEVLGLDLSGVDLVLLSACEGASGEVQSGEGIFGLRRAFQVAGAQAVVASLWPVADATARALMCDLHARLSAGGTTAARALQEAKRAELERRRALGIDTHPRHWAGFLVAGAEVGFPFHSDEHQSPKEKTPCETASRFASTAAGT